MIVLVFLAIRSSPDVNNVSAVDSTPIGMYVGTQYVTYNKGTFLLSDECTIAQKQQLKEKCVIVIDK